MSNYIRRFTFDNMNEVDYHFHVYGNDNLTTPEIEEILSTSNVFFVLSGLSRLQSTLICELGFSYVQQSQRYVPMDSTGFTFINGTNPGLIQDGKKLINKSIKLYQEMTKLKNPDKKGRLSKDDFVNGITYEDARCILPLCATTNVVTSMGGDGLVKLFTLFLEYPIVFETLKEEFLEIIPKTITHYIVRASYNHFSNNVRAVNQFYRPYFKDLNIENNVICMSIGNVIDQIAIGALASQNNESPEIVFDNWGENQEVNSEKIIKNVLGYGHTGISEQGRARFAMQCSLSTYHQVIRHRLQTIRREPFSDIINDNDREYVLPKNIKENAKYNKKVNTLIDNYKKFYDKYKHHVDYQIVAQFLLNCAPVRFMNSFNMRHINWVFRERLCFTAQDEIRNLYAKVFDDLYTEYPTIVKYGLPPCILNNGKCKEGKMSCGHFSEVKETYNKYI